MRNDSTRKKSAGVPQFLHMFKNVWLWRCPETLHICSIKPWPTGKSAARRRDFAVSLYP